MVAEDNSAGGSLWIVSAPSGGGKTSLSRALVRRLRARGIPATISVSYTTRAPRPGEQEGEDYHFVDEGGFVEMIARGEFLEHAQVFGRRYGTGLERTEALLAAGTELLLDIDWQGARQIRHQRPDARSVFILPPSAAELERRLRSRGQDDDGVIAQRMQSARTEMEHHGEYDYLVVNEMFEQALSELEALVLSHRLRTGVQQARHAGLLRELLGAGGSIAGTGA